jgi:hypothetical protein
MASTGKSGLKRAALLGIIISLLTIIVIFKFTETHLTWKVIYEVDIRFLMLAFLFHSLFWIFWAIRLKKLSEFLGIQITLSYAFKTTLASGFLAAITPSSAGGEPLRVKMLNDSGISFGASSAIVLAERLLDAIFFISALPVMIFISDFSSRFGIYAGVVFTLFFVGFMFFMYLTFKDPENVEKISAKISSFIARFSRSRGDRISSIINRELMLFRDASVELATVSKYQFSLLFILTALIWIFEFLVPSAILLAMKTSPHWTESLTSQLFLVIISLVPLTPGSSGIAEAGMLYFYSLFVEKVYIGSLVGLWRVITYYSNLIVGLIVNVMVLKSRYLEED